MKELLLKKEKEAFSELKTEISNRYELLWMKIFGSNARGDFDKESDLDIIVVL